MATRCYKIIVSIIFICSIGFTHAQYDDLKFDHLGNVRALASRSVTAMVQDQKGFLWFGTPDGLLRYDGYEIKMYKNEVGNANSLSDNNIRDLAVDTLGNIWIATQGGGLNQFITEKNKFVRYQNDPKDKNSLSGNATWSLMVDSKNNVWIGTWSNGLNMFDQNTGKFERQFTDFTEPILTIYEDSRGVIWAPINGLASYNPQTGETNYYNANTFDSNGLASSDVRVISEDGEGTLWIGTESTGLYSLLIEENEFQRYTTESDSLNITSSNAIYDIHIDENGAIWLATGNGIDIWDKPQGRTYHYKKNEADPYSLSNNSPRVIFKDRSGTVWIGNEGAMINKLLDKKNFKTYRHDPLNPNSLSNNVIRALYEDDQGLIWVGTQAGGLNVLNRETGEVKRFPSDTTLGIYVDHPQISAIYKDESGIMWVGTWGGGIYKLEVAQNRTTIYKHDPRNANSVPDDRIQMFHKDRFGDFWVGTENGLARFEPGSGKWRKFIGIKGSTIQGKAFKEEKDGTLWVGTWHGLNRIGVNRNDVKTYTHNPDDWHSLSSDHVISLHHDGSGHLWVGTFGGGFNKFDIQHERFTGYFEKDGLPNNVIYGILEDENNNLWLSTNNGLSQFNPTTEEFRNYDSSEGLQGNEFYWGAAYKNADGSLMFGGVNGLNIFFPSEITNNTIVPPIVISDFLIYNKPVSIGQDSILQKSITYTDDITISYKQAVITFNYAALNYNHSEKNQYAYVLEGFEDNWNDVGNKRTATYTNLDPGEYVFRVKGSNNDNIWNEKGIMLSLTVTPPFWRTWWFYIICAISAGSMFYGLIKFRERGLKRDKQALQRSIDEAYAEVENQKRAIAEQREKEKERIWTDQGMVRLGEVLSRSKDDIEELCHNVLKTLVDLMEVQVAAIYLAHENEEGQTVLVQRSAYGYDKSQQEFEPGMGLVGECYKENEVNYLTDLPPGYLNITSGLGNSSPSSLLLIPLAYEDIIIGVMEIASFQEIEVYKMGMVKIFSERLTTAINTTLLGEKTKKLLEDSKIKAEELAVREEELKQNLEEMEAIHEDRDRKTKELEETIKKLEETIKKLEEEIKRLKNTH
ncbi:hypothetical protein C900_02757 [Fulvivirga imtechensis AK7]|uniref:GAF domain-containing protein n=1 Tax=Fulvivirga imtechensis AK7 TaxID=1237149 RepID=L8JR15_9BACT|nr:two-component regulator propeller domain-containing protein [Fulvivirga imtechensis]ELR71416.1 hypothetical protein C900_02757 [Fulvivirga imtechensis AK7]